jgi:transposase
MREKLFTLTRKQRDDMERRYKQTTDRRVSDRIQCILLLDGGRNAGEVAEILRLSKKTIKRWVKVFAEHGLEDLCTLHYEGNDGLLTAEQLGRLEVWLDEGVRGTKEVIDWVERECTVSYSESGMTKLLARLDYSFKKPAVVPAKADPKAQEEWVARYLEKRGPQEPG